MNKRGFLKRADRYFSDMDYWLLVPVLLITLIGLFVMNKVLLAGYGAGSYPENFIKQFGAATFGLLLALLVCMLDEPTLELLGWFLYGLSCLLLVYEKIDSFSLKSLTGADSWIRLPIIGSFQPSELAKIAISIVAASFFARMKRGEEDYWHGFAKLGLCYGIPLILIYMEPDFGTAAVIVIMFLLTLFVWGVSWKIITAFAAVAFAGAPLLWIFFLSERQKNRVLLLLFPGQDMSESYHIDQALKAVSSGGLLGNQSGIDVHVPVKESDFIYSAIAEYLGFIGTTVLLILVCSFLCRALLVAWKASAEHLESAYMMVALIASMAFHFIENMGMNVGLLPITGIPLPFISNGGTSMLMNYFALGLMLNVSMNLRALEG